jgi:hypothetical protein
VLRLRLDAATGASGRTRAESTGTDRLLSLLIGEPARQAGDHS